MLPRLFDEWRAEWRLRRGASAYVDAIYAEPDETDVQWLAAIGTGGDVDRARWELRYARRALGLLVAERDALDDRTGSRVARQLRERMQLDRDIAAGMVQLSERQLNVRLAAYRQVLSTRSATEGTGARLGRTLLKSADGAAEPAAQTIEQAGEILARYVGSANESLRKAFGEVVLPEDQPPSIVFGGSGS
jgi:hypothetical protein